jgi:hypothetical protein
VCNLYSITTNQDAIRRLFGALNSSVGNLPPILECFPITRRQWCETPMVIAS